MDTPPPPPPPAAPNDAQVAQWLTLRHEMQVLHAQLEYMRLMLKLGVPQR